MNREKLETMTGKELVAYADKLGVKVNANKERTGLKESKKTAIDKIVKYENEHKPVEKTEKKTAKKSNKIDDILPIVLDALQGYVIKSYSCNRNYLIVKTNADKPKRIGEVDVLRNKITFYCKSNIENVPDGVECKGAVNKSLGNCYHIDYNYDYISNLMYLINKHCEVM